MPPNIIGKDKAISFIIVITLVFAYLIDTLVHSAGVITTNNNSNSYTFSTNSFNHNEYHRSTANNSANTRKKVNKNKNQTNNTELIRQVPLLPIRRVRIPTYADSKLSRVLSRFKRVAKRRGRKCMENRFISCKSENHTCCLSQSRYGCCPMKMGVCCISDATCCPHTYECMNGLRNCRPDPNIKYS